ncbi:MAG: uridine kinase [Candidatus Latescibacterota bacterium]|jgi:uridine kinase
MPSVSTCTHGAIPKPRLIAIAGPSGAGKTTLAKALVDALPGAVALLPLDAYYADRSDLMPSARARYNFDAPEALDAELLHTHLRALAAGHSIDIPVYDFASHSRQRHTLRIEPTDFVVVEGLFALYFDELLPLYTYRVFVDLADERCLQRRLIRDANERGRHADDVRRQYAEQVYPMYVRYIQPTRMRAQFVADGNGEWPEQIDLLLTAIDSVRQKDSQE